MEKLNHDVSRQKNFKLKGQRENADCSVQNPVTVGRRNPKNSATQTKAWMKQRRSASSRTSTLDNKNEYHSRFTALKLRISDDFFIGTDLTCLRNTLCASTLLFCPPTCWSWSEPEDLPEQTETFVCISLIIIDRRSRKRLLWLLISQLVIWLV